MTVVWFFGATAIKNDKRTLDVGIFLPTEMNHNGMMVYIHQVIRTRFPDADSVAVTGIATGNGLIEPDSSHLLVVGQTDAKGKFQPFAVPLAPAYWYLLESLDLFVASPIAPRMVYATHTRKKGLKAIVRVALNQESPTRIESIGLIHPNAFLEFAFERRAAVPNDQLHKTPMGGFVSDFAHWYQGTWLNPAYREVTGRGQSNDFTLILN